MSLKRNAYNVQRALIAPERPAQNNVMLFSEKLRDSILSEVLEPDQRLIMEEPASGMGVDRVHIREALLLLEPNGKIPLLQGIHR